MVDTAAYVLVPAFLVIAGVLLLTRRSPASSAARLIERSLRPGQWIAIRLKKNGDLEIAPIAEDGSFEEELDAKEVPGRDGVGGVEGHREFGQTQG